MASLYNKFAGNMKNSDSFGVGWAVFAILLAIALALGIEDYSTSLYGYANYPTGKVNQWVIYFVAALPQALQFGVLYFTVGILGVAPQDRAWVGRVDVAWIGLLIWFTAFAIDGYLDYSYKSVAYQTACDDMGMIENCGSFHIPIAIEAWVLYGLGSELLGSFALGVLIPMTAKGGFYAFTDIVGALVKGVVAFIIKLFRGPIGFIFEGMRVDAKKPDKPQQGKQGQQPQNSRREPDGLPTNLPQPHRHQLPHDTVAAQRPVHRQ